MTNLDEPLAGSSRTQGVTTTQQAPAPATGPDGAQPPARRGLRRLLGALAGLVAAAVALGVAELVAALVGPASSPVVAVGDTVITFVPEPVKQFAISTFGENDKIALVVGTLVVVALYALLIGLLSLRSRRLGVAGIALFGVVGALAAATRPAGGLLDALPSVVGALVGIVALLLLVDPLTLPAPAATSRAADEAVMVRLRDALSMADRKGTGMDRRRFFLTGGVALGAAAVTGGGGRFLQRRFDVSNARGDLSLPTPSSPAPALPPGADLAEQVEGLTPLFTPNRDFYRVDTALTVPQVRPADYRLELTGMFDSPRSYTLADLFGRDDVIERDVTLTCVSNEVGGQLAGTARWTGIPLGDLLRENGVSDRSDQLVCRSVDGMTIGAPTRSALEVEDAMIVFGMNGEPLPVEHGFPVRMLIPGLYGYVSACKWMTSIEATTYDAFDAYWVERDWAADGPIKLASRIDTPAPLRQFPAGRRAIAGVAWAQTRGIRRVEVRVDDGEWQEARLAPAVDADLWRQWQLPFDFAPGSYQLTVRATAADGEVQTEERARPFPNGASGLHSIRVIAT
ncbi:DMSO/TMAO reductase YedYZ, molybdopterin-dependent catalytic subunit [Geodermatophilus amargosae]|uniref:DMSO/TMAO reductase YedYZ, molybdopterin-dependent catalytic subunit n=1 Tax=Geodermatophilus amargosae TaxID=1296565 RepID=A0A1I6ZFW8_9ACTN|nr:molybdopterin-dependent oxidoreductase [Geodermatophilus amargosae]SFT61583.1 DMSO/TMAO reductase YedYZ, molybdopterin-dependent catalytic subunit [Geodermatophilus amargosae]